MYLEISCIRSVPGLFFKIPTAKINAKISAIKEPSAFRNIKSKEPLVSENAKKGTSARNETENNNFFIRDTPLYRYQAFDGNDFE